MPEETKQEDQKKDDQVKKILSTSQAYKKEDIDIKIDSYPSILKKYIEVLMEETCCNVVSATMNTLSMASSVLQKTLFIPKHGSNGIDGGYFQKLYPNLWLLEINKSGNFKTTVQNNAHEVAYRIENIIKETKKSLDNLAMTLMTGKESILTGSDCKNIKNIEYIPENIEEFWPYINSKTAFSLTEDQIKKSSEAIKDASIKRKSLAPWLFKRNIFIPTKVTLEALLKYLSESGGGVILSSEFTNWLAFVSGGMKNKSARATLTDLYDVPPKYSYATKTEGVSEIYEPFISICGALTYNSFKSLVSKEDILSGFLARFLLFTPNESKYEYPALPRKNTGNKISAVKTEMIEYLLQTPKEISYQLTEKAIEYFEWYHKQLRNFVNAYSQDYSELIEPFVKRWSPYFLKIAMLIQFFEDKSKNEITEHSIDKSLKVINSAFESTKFLIHEYITKPKDEERTDIIIQYLQSHNGSCKRKELISSHKLDNGSKEYDKILSQLAEDGRIDFISAKKKQDITIKLK